MRLEYVEVQFECLIERDYSISVHLQQFFCVMYREHICRARAIYRGIQFVSFSLFKDLFPSFTGFVCFCLYSFFLCSLIFVFDLFLFPVCFLDFFNYYFSFFSTCQVSSRYTYFQFLFSKITQCNFSLRLTNRWSRKKALREPSLGLV